MKKMRDVKFNDIQLLFKHKHNQKLKLLFYIDRLYKYLRIRGLNRLGLMTR